MSGNKKPPRGRPAVELSDGQAQTAPMNQTDVMIKIVEMAKVCGALAPESVIEDIAALIAELDVCSDSYEWDIERLVKIGATIWDLHSGPGGAYDPTWIPPILRP